MNTWEVTYSNKAAKALKGSYKKGLPQKVRDLMEALHIDLEISGPSAINWPSYGKLKSKKSNDLRHCHLENGRPTYVACWEVLDKKKRKLEVYYVGTHEKAPY